MNESEMIALFSAVHGITPYSADAELFGDLLLTMDSFSPDEDFFNFTSPERIGHNMAAAVLSDLLACGIWGEFLLNAWNIDSSLEKDFYARCAAGIEEVLQHGELRCIGGDMGRASPWSWCAVAGGHLTAPAPVRRIASRKLPFDLYVTGTLGDANYCAFFKKEMPEIELRSPVPPEALFATDTSGGFMDALENFRRVNPDLTLRLEHFPIAPVGELPFPAEFLLIGGVGEYELLYALPRGMKSQDILIGHGEFTGKGIMLPNKKVISSPPPDYRAVTQEKYLEVTENYYREYFL